TYPLRPHDFGGSRSYHLDHNGRFWIGYDAGEWSGHVASIPIRDKRPSVEGLYRGDFRVEGVHGFLELDDGQIWAYGGTVHEGVYRGYIARIDRGRSEMLGEFPSDKDDRQRRSPKKPRFPITHIVR